jgi:fatty acid desaturase
MYDSAHHGVFASVENNQRLAAITAGILGEFPSGWRYGHNRHHASPNVLGRDMDQSERWDPSRRYNRTLTAFAGLFLLTKYKGYYLPKTLLLVGIRDGYFCFQHARSSFAREVLVSVVSLSLQLAGLIWLFGGWGILLFLVHTSIGMIYLNTAFMGNHYDLDVFDQAQADELDSVELQIRTARNYTGGAWARYVFGGLEHQIEHHLFPSMPRHQFLRAEPFVRRFCRTHDLPYEVLPFSECIARVLRFHIGPAARSLLLRK